MVGQKLHTCRICKSFIAGNRHEPLRGACLERQRAFDHQGELAVRQCRLGFDQQAASLDDTSYA